MEGQHFSLEKKKYFSKHFGVGGSAFILREIKKIFL